jgi:hypothetical protein
MSIAGRREQDIALFAIVVALVILVLNWWRRSPR